VGLPNISEIIPGNVARSGGLEIIKMIYKNKIYTAYNHAL
jgi:hypothetical protein